MLAAIGVSSVEELFRDIPEGVRFGRELDLEPPLSEQELSRHLEELAARNVDTSSELSFLGAGIYDHYVPAVVDTVLQRGELLTAYTPYQPEMSQGVLQAIFEYQTVICELTGMDVSNASGYDGTTVAADACYVAKHATGPNEGRGDRGDKPAGAAGGQDVRARFRARDRRSASSRRRHGPGRATPGGDGCGVRDLPAAELLRLPRAGAGPRRRSERRGSHCGCARRPDLARRAGGTGRLRLWHGDRRRARARATISPSPGRTMASSLREANSSAACPAGSSARRWTPRGSAAMS